MAPPSLATKTRDSLVMNLYLLWEHVDPLERNENLSAAPKTTLLRIIGALNTSKLSNRPSLKYILKN